MEKETRDNIPELSHLQFAVLEALGSAELSGRDLRQKLTETGINKSGPAFYQMMARLEEAKFVKGWYDQKIIDAQIIKERRYKITSDGAKAVFDAYRFYQLHARSLLVSTPSLS